MIAQQSYAKMTDYSPVSVTFNSGPNISVVVFVGFTSTGQGGPWIHVDDFSLEIGDPK